MAYFGLSSLAQTIHQILDSDQYHISDNEKHRITSLRENVVFLKEFLEKSPTEATSLEKKITDAANKAEDILEHFMYDQIRSIRTTNNPSDYFDELETVMMEINLICWYLNPTIIELIKKMLVAINSISPRAVDVKSLNKTENVVGDSPATVRYAVGGVTVGLDDDVLKIKDLLTGGSSKLHTISIAGMGGIGKSTLAMNAYNDPLVMETFTVRAWVTVSQEYKAEDILSVLVDCFKEVGDLRSGDTVMEKTYKFLYGRKYLIVLDDVWSMQAWDDVKKAFPDGGDGSRIILTTRLRDVASHASPLNYIHQMSFMDEYRSWDLLKQKVFAKKPCPSALVDVGMDIARSCGGLPLAIVLVAGILSTVDKTRFSWLEVAKEVRSCVDGKDGQFEKVISLSYTHLPHHLRACFLYIKLWIAEGFVEPRRGKSMEECAEELLDDLVKRSLVLVRKRKPTGKIKSCNVHDLVRDICRRKALEENLQRRRSIARPDPTLLSKIYSSTMRSVTCFGPGEIELGAVTLCTLLRVLDLVEVNDLDSLPVPVFDLFHLRYLGFSCGGSMKIPAAISRLQNLHTLMICRSTRWKRHFRNPKHVVHLPFEIWMMPLLTHVVSSFPLSLNLEGVASTLENLVTLSEVRRFTCCKKMIEMIPNIKKLGITYDDNDAGDYELHNLVLLHQLENLKLTVDGVALKVNPVFPKTLKKLTLSGCRFPWKYMETVGSLLNLQVLKLKRNACEGHTWETQEEQFPNLEFLYIHSSDLENLVTESSHFPRLKRLVFLSCFRLSEIPDDIGEIPTLELIEVDSYNTSLLKCARRIQEDQLDNGNYDLQVRCLYDFQTERDMFALAIKEATKEALYDMQVAKKQALYDMQVAKIQALLAKTRAILDLYYLADAMKEKEERDLVLRQKSEEKEWAYRKGQSGAFKNWHFRGVGRDGAPRRRAQPAGQKNPHFGGSGRGCPPRKRT